MSTQRWQRIKQLFEKAVALPQPQRSMFAKTAAFAQRFEPEMVLDLLSLLEAHQPEPVDCSRRVETPVKPKRA